MKFIKYFLGVIIIVIAVVGGAFYFFEDSVVRSVCVDKFAKDKKACALAVEKSIGTAKEEQTREYCKEALKDGYIDWCVGTLKEKTRDSSIPLSARIGTNVMIFLKLGIYSQ